MGKNLTILVVEDKEENLNAAREFFKCKEINCFYATNFKQALRILNNNNINLAIIDECFPEDEGKFPSNVYGKNLELILEKKNILYCVVSGGGFVMLKCNGEMKCLDTSKEDIKVWETAYKTLVDYKKPFKRLLKSIFKF